MKRKTVFGLNQFTNRSPKWLVPTYAAIMLAIGVASFLLKNDPIIEQELKDRIDLYLTGFGMFVSGLAPLFGVKTKL